MTQDNELQTTVQNYTLICKLAKCIFSEWEGRIEEEKSRISLVSFNMLGDKRIECKCSIGLLNSEKYPFCVDGEEKTCSIIGGCGCPCENLEEVKKEVDYVLKRYNFRQKDQISLFDYEWQEEL